MEQTTRVVERGERLTAVRGGVDLAKRVIQVHAVDATGHVLTSRALVRDKFIAWCAQLPAACVVALATRLDAFFGKEIDIRSFDQLVWCDAQLAHELVRFACTCFQRLTLTEHDLELEKMPQPFHSVEVHACSPNKKQSAMLGDATGLPVGKGQRLSKNPWR